MALFIRSKKYIKYTNYQIFTRNTYCFITLSCRNTVIPVDWLLTNKIKKYFFLRLMRHCLQQWTTVIIFLHFLISNISEIFFLIILMRKLWYYDYQVQHYFKNKYPNSQYNWNLCNVTHLCLYINSVCKSKVQFLINKLKVTLFRQSGITLTVKM